MCKLYQPWNDLRPLAGGLSSCSITSPTRGKWTKKVPPFWSSFHDEVVQDCSFSCMKRLMEWSRSYPTHVSGCLLFGRPHPVLWWWTMYLSDPAQPIRSGPQIFLGGKHHWLLVNGYLKCFTFLKIPQVIFICSLIFHS